MIGDQRSHLVEDLLREGRPDWDIEQQTGVDLLELLRLRAERAAGRLYEHRATANAAGRRPQ